MIRYNLNYTDINSTIKYMNAISISGVCLIYIPTLPSNRNS